MANLEGVIQGRGDYPLSDKGRAQAEKTAEALDDFEAELVFTSPLERARITAQIVSRGRAQVEELAELLEYDLGGFEGLTFAEICERFPSVPADLRRGTPFHHLAPGAETDPEVDARATRAIDLILTCPHERVIVVSHLGILERMIRIIIKQRCRAPAPGRSWPLRNCSITRIKIEAEETSILAVNEVSHLE